MSFGRRAALAAVVLVVVALAASGLLRAVRPAPTTPREQVDAVAATIRCPTCQGLSIKDSPSVLAAGARKIVEDQVAQGRTPDQIRQYFVDRYGTWILLSPRPDGPGLLVWVLPLLAVPAAGGMASRWVRQRRAAALAVAVGPSDGDGDAATALAAYRSGDLDPDASPAGEALREALLVRTALEQDDTVAADPDAVAHADARLAAAARRYRSRALRPRPVRTGMVLPRRTVTVLTIGVLLAGVGTALAVGVRPRSATGLPTGDLPGGVAASGQQISDLVAATRERPQDGSAWLALGRAYAAGQQYAPALQAYDQARRFGGGDDAVLQRAGVLVRMGKAAEALPSLQDVATRRPGDPDTVLLLGLAQRASGAPEATATLRRFLQLAPDSAAASGVRDLLAGR